MDVITRVNTWYEGVPETLRMSIIPAILIVVGGINMSLTIAHGFPFALLFLLALAVILAVRAPYAMGWVQHHETETGPARRVQLEGLDWLYELNRRYDALPEVQRFAVIPAVLILVGWLNMALTIAGRFPFGLLFLIALLAVVAFRAPFAMGWIKPPVPPVPGAEAAPQVIAHEPSLASSVPPEAAVEATPVVHHGPATSSPD